MTTEQTTYQDNTGLPVQYENAPTFAVAEIVAKERADLDTLGN